jgi:membrane-bound lytic murein transglycosylase MltF
MRNLVLLAAIIFNYIGFAQTTWADAVKEKTAEIEVYYLENVPFAYKDKNGELTGIEIDLIKEFKQWLYMVKEVDANFKFKPYKDFNKLYNDVKNAKTNVLGLATVSVTKDRMKEVFFTSPYLKNNTVLASHLSVNTIMSIEDLATNFKDLTAVAVKGSKGEADLLKLKEKYLPQMRIAYVQTPAEITEKINDESGKYFGYVDLITYWDFVKKKGGKVKIHREATDSRDRFAFIMPQISDWQPVMNEFFEGGFGITSTEEYYNILKKHLGFEIIKAVELF